MHGKSTLVWYLTRILLVVGFIATAVVVFLVFVAVEARPMGLGHPWRVLGVRVVVLWGAFWAVVAVFGLVWMIRIFRGLRDEPPPDATSDAPIHGKRTEGWYLTRVALAAGVLTVIAGALAFMSVASPRWEPPWVIPTLPSVIVAVGFLVGLAGLVWMIRIFRGPRDEPPPWRHRDR